MRAERRACAVKPVHAVLHTALQLCSKGREGTCLCAPRYASCTPLPQITVALMGTCTYGVRCTVQVSIWSVTSGQLIFRFNNAHGNSKIRCVRVHVRAMRVLLFMML